MQSFEVRISEKIFSYLSEIFQDDPNCLVAGPVLSGHNFMGDINSSANTNAIFEIRGTTCPWNTFAAWSTRKLSLTGFPLVAEGDGRLVSSGVEVFYSAIVN